MTRIEELIALAEARSTASSLLAIERIVLASMRGPQDFDAMSRQMDRIRRIEIVVETFDKQMMASPPPTARGGVRL